ncbi:RecQ-mediated genome instability protein 1 [Capsicum baccatum]|uniref:RecQ-mediated genome instability protein 1 n=1 Tax=Capsicum baccatum TaxID=33114 RepID=A0A2G2X236_CAPBA|nr:RecQ-mediated genome instability protein 1 [Capsicum baccatum]
MTHQEIVHQTSCPYTPQQNGIAERKNRHLLEAARTLLIESHVPLQFWGDAVLTSCYLINRMPSSSIQNRVPHSILFPQSHLYFIPPRVFGSTCFVHNLAPEKDKLAPRALKNTKYQISKSCNDQEELIAVDEIVNISCPLRDRYQKAAAGIKRCLKLSMTDGIQRVFGMEYRPIKDLDVLAPSGLKVAICNVHIRHGLMMLVPEVMEVLGGMVEELEEARQRLVNEINKPPRGKRTRSGVVPPLATRATNAAWPREGVTAPEHADTSSRQSMHFQVPQQGMSGVATSATEEIHPITPGLSSAPTITTPVYRRDAQSNFPSTPAVSVPFNMNVTRPTFPSHAASHAEDIHMADMTTECIDVPIRREHNDPVCLSSSSMEVEELLPDVRSGPATPASSRSRGSVPVSSGSVHNEDVEPDSLSTAATDVEEIDLVDELDHPFILSGGKENPFTYLASLSAKQAGMNGSASAVTGKIKCFLTGVKGFQYRQTSKYELRVYVDDGSLISEILIDHALVQKKISFSPEEVTAAISSSDSKRVSDMKETLKCFQKFLINFEGTMLVHLNVGSPVPVATEMNQGCPASDARLLLKRLKPSTSPRAHHLHQPETINLSP